MRVMVIGASGHFGARILRALQQEPGIELVACGRRSVSVPGVAGVALDVTAPDYPRALQELSPGLVINCTGPFQSQGYSVVRAALAAGAHCVDLADGRAFVEGFPEALRADAEQARRAAITGASTLPAVSAAVVEALSKGLSSLRSIETVIAPGQRAPRGRATREAVFSYLGRPFEVWRDGRWRTMHGWMSLKRVRLDAGVRLAAACDVPDLALFPRHFAGVQTVTFHAALELAVQHIALWSLAASRRLGLPFPVRWWAAALERMAGLFDAFAGDHGGMAVTVAGTRSDGAAVARSWQLTVSAVNGPEIPCMPAILLARLLARGVELPTGAYPCIGLLRLADFEPELRKWGIVTRTVEVLL